MNKNYYDELLDSKIKVAGMLMLENVAEQAPSDEGLIEFVSGTDDLDKKIMASINKEVNKRRARRGVKIAARVAAALLVLVAISAITVSSTEALRIKFLNYFVVSNDEEMVIIITDTDNDDPHNPLYMTQGYVLVDYIDEEYFVVSMYAGSGDDYIRIERHSEGGTFSFDTERSTSYETEIMGFRAIVVQFPDTNMVYLFVNENVYIIGGTVSLEELIEIAEGLSL